MKIQCDVCNKEEASVFCSADEAALCDSCDRHIHHANKLAEKHSRFSLLHPSSKESPLCDICQAKRAFLFCKEDRAILCRECDISIHMANEHSQKHDRFLLTGVKLSNSSSLYPTSSSGSSNGCNNITAATDYEVKPSKSLTKKDPNSVYSEICNPPSEVHDDDHHHHHHHYYNHMSDTSSVSTSSISEYLETLPGWHVEDFLDPCPNPFGLCKLMMDQDVDSSTRMTSFSSNATWVPQFSPSSSPHLLQNGWMNGFKESKEGNNTKFTRKFVDSCSSVPQICPPSVKKSRHL